jgi:nitroimidazol reductase NimA-like FMN-containing flavoprotein (pyridoxamine 5'-phosphate oxidase superfamily)
VKTWIEDRSENEDILKRMLVGRLGLASNGEPYIVPLNYAYEGGRIYFHTGLEGRKLEALQKSPRVCFEVDELLGVIPQEQACLFTTHYRSVMVWGTARLLRAEAEKMNALQLLVRKYGAGKEYETPPKEALDLVSVCEIEIDTMSGKANLPDTD